ncbi:MAG: 3-hydroxyacyl-CoA dehydrogenase family protein, partial [bacterium]
MTEKEHTWDDVEILVVGAGIMGASIAQAYAQNGFTVGLLDISDDILARARKTIDDELNAARGRIFSDEEIKSIGTRILMTTDYPTACRGKNLRLAIETATERIDIKLKIFKELDKLCAPDVVLATNSSSLDTNVLAQAVSRPDRIVWMHYFYLPHKNRAGEVAGTDSASPESIDTAMYYMKMGGKVATPITSSRKGGAADVLFVALLLEACRMAEEGFEKADIEAAGRVAFDMPLGFLGLMDATGLPIAYYAMKSFSDDSNPSDPLYGVYKDFFR